MKSAELRESFLKYFEGNDHARVPSSSLVPANDPTLFFTNAGMVQFKEVFLGNERRPYKRATTSQKCMRVSGKHNDLENVGHTPRHHTFFEMLGNFSFGDYFKEDAVVFAWEYLTKRLHLPEKQLYITIYKDDDDAEKIWKKLVDKSKIFRLGDKDNFWAMADVGPCGPCSEILFDRNPTGSVKIGDLEDDRFMEIWNLVFMQYVRSAGGKLTKLTRPSIDTGMGLERLSAVVNNVHGNYETDLFRPVITELEGICEKKYQSKYSVGVTSDVSMRVVADHVRAMVFLIGDGVQPSNEGRGYVLRRIIRRAARHGKLLKIANPFFVPLAHMVIDMMGASYPELIQHREFIEKVIFNEEGRFNETLEKGLEILEGEFKKLKKDGIKKLPGEEVFKLYDTYGFPKDLTEDIAADADFSIDHDGFERFMTGQRERARGAWKGSGEEVVEGVYKELGKKGIKSEFVGYEKLSCDAKVISILKNGREVDSAVRKDKISFVTDITPFYGESGGQVGDTGLGVADDLEVSIVDTKRPVAGLVVHHGEVVKGELKKGAKITLAVDADRRVDIMNNHTATHILHRALRETLGEHVKQSGSFVAPERLRFDFSHFTALTKEEIAKVEADANRIIRMNLPVKIEVLPYKEAIERGALAFFGDKYGDKVRTVSIGTYSSELCGGSHVSRTGDIGMIKIIGESSVASGIRRIEAVTGRGVEEYVRKVGDRMSELANSLKVSEDEVEMRVDKLVNDNKKMRKELEKARSHLLSGKSVDTDSEIETVGEIKVITRFVDGAVPNELRTLSDTLKSKVGSGVIMLVTESDSKTSLLIAVTKDLTKSISAGNIMKEVVASIGGTGGGRSDMAQGGAGVTGKYKVLKEKLREVIR